MKRYMLLSGGLLCVMTGSACAAQDVDLLTYDPIPQKKESDAPPVDVLPPEVKVEQDKPDPVEPPVKKVEQPSWEPAPVMPPSRPQPPVNVEKPKDDITKPAVKKTAPPVTKPGPSTAPVVKADSVVPPPPEAALPKAIETPAIRPVIKVTEPDVKPERMVQPAPIVKDTKRDEMKHSGPKPVVVPPPTLNANIDPVPVEDLHDAVPPRSMQTDVMPVDPPPAPEASVKARPSVIELGDPLRIEVAGESDLSGWYKVMPDGSVTLPIIGKVRAQGFTHTKLAEILTETLKDGYLVNPVVTVTGKAAP